MPNPIYQALNQNQSPNIQQMAQQLLQAFSQNRQADVLQIIQQCKTNPQMFLGGFNIPQNIIENPFMVAQYLVQSGRFPQEQLNQATMMARQRGYIG